MACDTPGPIVLVLATPSSGEQSDVDPRGHHRPRKLGPPGPPALPTLVFDRHRFGFDALAAIALPMGRKLCDSFKLKDPHLQIL